jgi:hypothetical protein
MTVSLALSEGMNPIGQWATLECGLTDRISPIALHEILTAVLA